MTRLLTICSIFILLNGVYSNAQTKVSVSKKDTNNQLRLWYKHPATQWMQQALPIGNGSVGAMVFGGIGKEHLQFNEKTLWSGKPMEITNPVYRQKMDSIKGLLAGGKVPEANALLQKSGVFSREHFGAYSPLGDLFMEFDHGDSVENYHRELDLSKALVKVSYRHKGVNYRREYFASFPDQIIVMRISADKPGKISMRVSMNSPLQEGKIVATDLDLVLKGKMPESGMDYSSFVKLKPQGGEVLNTANSIEVKQADAVVILLSAKTNYEMNWPTCLGNTNVDAVTQKLITVASKKTYAQLLNAHVNDYGNLFNRVQFKVNNAVKFPALPTDEALIAYTKARKENIKEGGDPSLESLLFHYGRYLMIASSRKGSLPANLQGLWNDSKTPAWDSDYHTDINIEMNYWINGPANLSECFSPFADYVDFLRKQGRKTAKDYFNANGFFVNIYTNPWGYSGPRWAWTGATGWLCQNLYDHFLFTGNETYLKETAYPIMKEACSFYLDLLLPYKGQSLVVSPSLSPEINFIYEDGKSYRISAGAAIDQQIVYDLFTNTIEAAHILNTDASLIKTLEDRLKRLSPPLKVGKDGSLQEWIEDWKAEDVTHRHISHLYALYPGKMIDPTNTIKEAKAASAALAMRGNNHTGWGTAWRIACYARLGDGEKAHDFFKSLIRYTNNSKIVYKNGGGAYENLLTCHSPFQIDGNFGFTAAVAEMLLQSHTGNWQQGQQIQLLPALPSVWADGEIKGLLARGGFTVDMEWKAGKLINAVITSKYDKMVNISYHKKEIKLKLKKGKSVSLDKDLNLVSKM